MKSNLFLLLSSSLILFACSNETKTSVSLEPSIENIETVDASSYESFGGEFTTDGLLTSQEMQKKYDQMAVGDSMAVTFRANVGEVCQKKGCWMKMDLNGKDSEAFVRFKDYEFFVPKDAEGSDAILKGMAYKEETSVEELRHYAQDAGKSKEEIAAITEPKIEYTFMAEGVLLKKKLDEK